MSKVVSIGGWNVTYEIQPEWIGDPLLYFDLFYQSGQMMESSETRGLAHMCAIMMDDQTRATPSKELKQTLLEQKMDVEGILGPHLLGLEVCAYSDNLSDVLHTSLEMLTQPVFAPNKLASEKAFVVEEIQQLQHEPEKMTSMLFFEQMFAGHPYGWHAYGTQETVQRFTPRQLDQMVEHSKLSPCALSIACGMPEDELLAMLEKHLPVIQCKPWTSHYELMTLDKDILIEKHLSDHLAHVALGHRLCGAGHEDHFPLLVMQAYLGGFTGRLMDDIRETQGLVYDIDMSCSFLKDAGCSMVSFSTEPHKVSKVLSRVQQAFDQLCQRGISDEDLARIQTQLSGQYQMEGESMWEHVHRLNQSVLYDMSTEQSQWFDRLNAVTPGRVQEVAKTYLQAPCVQVMVLPD